MIQWFTMVAVVIAVLAIALAVHLHYKFARLAAEYHELHGNIVGDQLKAWAEAQNVAPAAIRVSWTRAGTAAYRVTLENIGASSAEQVRFNLMSSNGYCPLEPDVIARLFPVTLAVGQEHTIFALPSRWMSDPFQATVIWQAADGSQLTHTADLFYEAS